MWSEKTPTVDFGIWTKISKSISQPPHGPPLFYRPFSPAVHTLVSCSMCTAAPTTPRSCKNPTLLCRPRCRCKGHWNSDSIGEFTSPNCTLTVALPSQPQSTHTCHFQPNVPTTPTVLTNVSTPMSSSRPHWCIPVCEPVYFFLIASLTILFSIHFHSCYIDSCRLWQRPHLCPEQK
jgi:hypothetical protein